LHGRAKGVCSRHAHGSLPSLRPSPVARDGGGAETRPAKRRNCISPCEQFTPQPCPDINDDACYRKMVKQQHQQDQCIRKCEESFWGSFNGAGYGQFKLR